MLGLEIFDRYFEILGKTFFKEPWEKYEIARGWKLFHQDNPDLVEYLKPYKEPSALAHKWQTEGLSLPDKKFAEQTIFRENYYRFKAYRAPFFDKTINRFHVGTSFDDIYNLYCADQKLRDFLIPLLARLEVRIRAVVDNVIASATKDPFWHLDPSIFNNFDDVRRALQKAQSRFQVGKQEFVVHYRANYFTKKSSEFRSVPPFWIISEIFTLEQLVSVFKSINKDHPSFVISAGSNRLSNAAKHFDLNSYDQLLVNLRCIMELRNLCAHHNRLWNRNLQQPAGLKGIALKASHPNRLYSHLLMLRKMCKKQDIEDGIEAFMTKLIAQTPVFQRDSANMGFPNMWNTDPVWT